MDMQINDNQSEFSPMRSPIDSEKQARHTFNYMLLCVFGLFVYVNVAELLLALLIRNTVPSFEESSWYQLVLTAAAFYATGIPFFYLLSKHIPDGQKRKEQKLAWWKVACMALISFFLMYLSNFISLAFNFGIGKLFHLNLTNPLEDTLTGMNMWVVFLLTVVLAPIFEELTFRKILLGKLLPYGEGVAIIVSGVAFGLFHGNLFQCLYAAVLGIIFGYVVAKTNRIRYTILLHMIVNFVGSIVALNVLKSESLVIIGLFGMTVMAVFFSGMILFVLSIVFKKIKLEPTEAEIPKGFRFRIAVCNPGMILFFIATVISSILYVVSAYAAG
ncbi:MAG: type II CAAX endopeptidase family protein [Clostridiales bacterium]|nr:type II CAAX endopeptidase family protein [Clostridiales bacterium]